MIVTACTLSPLLFLRCLSWLFTELVCLVSRVARVCPRARAPSPTSPAAGSASAPLLAVPAIQTLPPAPPAPLVAASTSVDATLMETFKAGLAAAAAAAAAGRAEVEAQAELVRREQQHSEAGEEDGAEAGGKGGLAAQSVPTLRHGVGVRPSHGWLSAAAWLSLRARCFVCGGVPYNMPIVLASVCDLRPVSLLATRTIAAQVVRTPRAPRRGG